MLLGGAFCHSFQEHISYMFRDSTLARTARSVIRRENSSTGRVFYTAPTSNPFGADKSKTTLLI